MYIHVYVYKCIYICIFDIYAFVHVYMNLSACAKLYATRNLRTLRTDYKVPGPITTS